jgi:hypothetical protein
MDGELGRLCFCALMLVSTTEGKSMLYSQSIWPALKTDAEQVKKVVRLSMDGIVPNEFDRLNLTDFKDGCRMSEEGISTIESYQMNRLILEVWM